MIDWIREEMPDSELPRLVETLIEWCEINSGSFHLPGLERMHDRLSREFGSIAESTESIPLSPVLRRDECGAPFELELGRALRFRTRPDAPLQVLFSGHYDTVYGAEHPFQTCELSPDGKRLKGPGVADMKGGLLVMLESLRLLETFPGKEAFGWEVLLNPEEEIGTPGARDLLKEAANRCDFGLVFECATLEGELVQKRLGTGLFAAEVTGRSAHAGRDFEEGRNAIEALSALILEFRKIYREMDGMIINTARFHGATAMNSVPDRAIAQFNIRVPDQDSIGTLNSKISEALKRVESEFDVSIAWEGQFDRPPRIPNAAISGMEASLARCFQDFDLPVSWRDTGGGTDGSLLLDYGLPNIDSLGVRGAFLHSDRECMDPESLLERIRVTTLFLLRAANGGSA
ncbi:MAG: hydrolase [Verrucomicrobiales bacterium]|nr:hydrolase [Verrucomicrobiales bacterium]